MDYCGLTEKHVLLDRLGKTCAHRRTGRRRMVSSYGRL